MQRIQARITLLIALLVGCASIGPGGNTAASGGHDGSSAKPSIAVPDCPRARSFDDPALEAEISCLLAAYVRIDTTNPPGDEIRAARFLAAVLEREGVASEIVESEPGRANLVARFPASGEPTGAAVVLLHHMDVVPADPSEWSVPPLQGVVRDGHVWGRGSLDNKSGGIAQMVALLVARRAAMALPRDVLFVAVADEEAGGGKGGRWLVNQRPDLFEGVAAVLNEGGAIFDFGGGPLVYTVEVAQKAPLWLRLTASGESGHGSKPHLGAATHVLARALGRLEAFRFPVVVSPEVQTVFAGRAQAMPEPTKSQYMDLAASLRTPGFRGAFLADPQNAALVQNTLAITMLSGSSKENVLPGIASAVLDIRLLPGQDPTQVTEVIRGVIAEPTITIETLLSWPAHASTTDTEMFAAIRGHAESVGAVVLPNVIGGFTDCSAFRAKGIACYGFLPLQLRLADLAGFHGKDEKVSIAGLAKAAEGLAAIIGRL